MKMPLFVSFFRLKLCKCQHLRKKKHMSVIRISLPRLAKNKCNENLIEIRKYEEKNLHYLSDICINWSTLNNKNVTVRKSTIPNAGRGLFANITFNIDDCVAEYNGKIIGQKEVDKLTEQNQYQYIAQLTDFLAIDGYRDEKTGLGSFVNDIRTKTKHNAYFYVSDYKPNNDNHNFGRKTNLRVFLIASNKIEKGDEIFVSYGSKYWEIFKNKHLC